MRLVALLWAAIFLGQAFGQTRYPSFSVDERLLAFQLCDPRCRIVIVPTNGARGAILEAATPQGSLTCPAFDPHSEKIAFIRNEKQSDGFSDSQVVTSHRDGSGSAVLTSSDTFKFHPRFSPDGKAIAFLGVERNVTPNAQRKYLTTDVYEYDASKGTERRITDLRTIGMSAASYMADGKHIVFATVGSARPRANGKAPSIPLEKLYPGKTIFVFPIDGPQNLSPVPIPTLTASDPIALRDGSLAFLSRVKEDQAIAKRYQFAVFVLADSRAKQLTSARANVLGYAISASRRYVAFVRPGRRPGFLDSRISVWDGNTNREFDVDYGNAPVFRVASS
jgi:dipeptidyl aminopeptidase/acylaminoacyl peptidase